MPIPQDSRIAGEGLADVMPSAAAALDVRGFDDRLGLGSHRAVIVLLVDGLGWNALQSHADLVPGMLMGTGRERPISAAFPSTTPVGLGSLGMGLPPGAHGMVGATFWVPEEHAILHPLGWKDEPHPLGVQPERTVMQAVEADGVLVRSVGPRAFSHSGLTRAVLRGGEYIGADSFGERVAETIAPAGEAAERVLTYCYWGDLDKTGHVHGVDSPAWRQELRHVGLLVQAIRRGMPEDAVLVVTADHGMVDCSPAEHCDIDAVAALREGVARIAGEPRMRHVYARHGSERAVEEAWRERLGERARVLSRDQAMAEGLFGESDGTYDDRIGDVLAIARGRTALVSPRFDSKVSSLLGQHGALTDDEMLIPYLVLGRED